MAVPANCIVRRANDGGVTADRNGTAKLIKRCAVRGGELLLLTKLVARLQRLCVRDD